MFLRFSEGTMIRSDEFDGCAMFYFIHQGLEGRERRRERSGLGGRDVELYRYTNK